MAPLRCVYCDLDGTLLAADGSFLHGADGDFSLLGARALEACARAGAEVVVHSGRSRSALAHDARMLGLRSYAFGAGAGVVLDGELHRPPGEASTARAVAFHMRARGYAPEECIAVGGDSGAAEAVGTYWLVERSSAAEPAPNVRMTEEPGGAGVYEAVITELAERR